VTLEFVHDGTAAAAAAGAVNTATITAGTWLGSGSGKPKQCHRCTSAPDLRVGHAERATRVAASLSRISRFAEQASPRAQARERPSQPGVMSSEVDERAIRMPPGDSQCGRVPTCNVRHDGQMTVKRSGTL